MGATLELDGMITGGSTLEIASSSCDTGNTVTLTSGCSTFCGGVRVDEGDTTLVVGSSSEGTGYDVSQGPLGTGTLMLSSGNNFTTIGSCPIDIGNNITLCDGGTVTLLGGSMGGNLQLDGMITGGSTLEIASSCCDSANTVTLTSGCSTFCGGVRVDEGSTTLAVGASSEGTGYDVSEGPLGTGTLMLSSGNNFTTTGSCPIDIGNNITLCDGGTVTLLGGSMGGNLQLDGMITGGSTLEIASSSCDSANTVTLTSGCSTFCGGVRVDEGSTTLAVGASSEGTGYDVSQGPLGTGTLMLSSGNTLTTTGSGCFTIGNNITLCDGGTVNLLNEGCGTMLTLGGMITGCSTLEVAAPYSESESPNSLYLTSGCSTFSGGVHMDPGYAGLFVGASSSGGSGCDVTSGPLGTGTLMLSNGNDFETNGDGCITIGNNITLCDGGTVYMEAAYGGNNLTLSGMITGGSLIDVGYETTNYLALTSGCSTFCGGVRVEDGCTTLAIGASSTGTGCDVSEGPLGTGTLMLSAGNNFTTTGSGCFTIGNNITLCGGTVTLLGGGSSGPTLELDGTISGSSALNIAAAGDGTNTVVLTGCNTYSGGTTVNSSVLNVESNTGLGTGPLTANSSTVNFNTGSPTLTNLSMTGSSINFEAGSTPSIIDMVSDAEGSGNIINLGDDDPTTLTIQVDSDPKYYGTIVGAGSLVVTTESSGTLELESANTYNGGTTIGAPCGEHTLVVADNCSALGTGPVTLNSGGVLGVGLSSVTITNPITISCAGNADIGGYGTIAPSSPDLITIQNGSGVVGGHGTLGNGGGGSLVIGTLSFGTNASVVFGGSGGMQFSIMNAVGTPGTDFSAIEIAGNLNISATSSCPFTVQLVGVDSTGYCIGTANTFNSSLPYSWTLVTAGSLTGFTGSNQFLVDSSTYFSNATGGGQFMVTDSGNSLVLNFTPVPEPSTWAMMAGGLCTLVAALRRRRR